MVFMMSLVVWVLGGSNAFSQTPAGDTPEPPSTVQEESSTSEDQGEVIERGIRRGDQCPDHASRDRGRTTGIFGERKESDAGLCTRFGMHRVGISGTPGIIVGTELVPGALDLNGLKELISRVAIKP
jgi:hypothetical protein